MAKGQKRSSREAKKPKQPIKKVAVPVSPFDARQQGQKKKPGAEPGGTNP